MFQKIFLFLILFLSGFSRLPSVYAEEFMSPDLGRQIAELQKGMQSLQGVVVDLQKTVTSQNALIAAQSSRLEVLEGSRAVQMPSAGPAQTSGSSGPSLRGLAQSIQPDIGVAGTVQAHLTENTEDEEGKDTIALKELELGLSQYVDPFSRLDAILAFNDAIEDQNVEIEEAYYTRWGLPLGFSTQLGKFRSKIGKANLVHTHALETADYPLVIQDFFGEHGLSSSGVRLQNMIPNPWDVPLEISGEVLRGNNGTSFSGKSRRPIFNLHGKTFFETSDSSQLELGLTTLFGDENPTRTLVDGDGVESELENPGGQDRYGVRVFGADATMNWILPEGKTAKWQNEIYLQGRSRNPHPNDDPWGFYSLLDYRFSPRFSAGIRFDYVQPLDVTKEHFETYGISPYLTFWQSEFASFQIQYQHLEPASADAKTDDGVYLRCNFLVGSHQHPVQ